MSWLSSLLKFDQNMFKDQWKGIKKDPKRLILGVDPVSTAGWNAVLGREDQPLVNEFGGPTEQNFENAEARGIDTGPGRTAHGVAKTIAGFYGMQGAGGALGGAGGGAGQGANWAQYARMGQGAMGAMQPTPAPAYAPPPINGGPRSGATDVRMPANQGPGPVMTSPRQKQLLAQILRSGGGRLV